MEEIGTYSGTLGRALLWGTLEGPGGGAATAPISLQRQSAGWALWAQLVFNAFQLQPQTTVYVKGHRDPPLALEMRLFVLSYVVNILEHFTRFLCLDLPSLSLKFHSGGSWCSHSGPSSCLWNPLPPVPAPADTCRIPCLPFRDIPNSGRLQADCSGRPYMGFLRGHLE